MRTGVHYFPEVPEYTKATNYAAYVEFAHVRAWCIAMWASGWTFPDWVRENVLDEDVKVIAWIDLPEVG